MNSNLGLFGSKSCVFLIKMAADSGMKLQGLRHLSQKRLMVKIVNEVGMIIVVGARKMKSKRF